MFADIHGVCQICFERSQITIIDTDKSSPSREYGCQIILIVQLNERLEPKLRRTIVQTF